MMAASNVTPIHLAAKVRDEREAVPRMPRDDAPGRHARRYPGGAADDDGPWVHECTAHQLHGLSRRATRKARRSRTRTSPTAPIATAICRGSRTRTGSHAYDPEGQVIRHRDALRSYATPQPAQRGPEVVDQLDKELPSEIRTWIGRQLFEHVPNNIAVIDRDFNVVVANSQFKAVFGDPVGKHCFEVYKSRDARLRALHGCSYLRRRQGPRHRRGRFRQEWTSGPLRRPYRAGVRRGRQDPIRHRDVLRPDGDQVATAGIQPSLRAGPVLRGGDQPRPSHREGQRPAPRDLWRVRRRALLRGLQAQNGEVPRLPGDEDLRGRRILPRGTGRRRQAGRSDPLRRIHLPLVEERPPVEPRHRDDVGRDRCPQALRRAGEAELVSQHPDREHPRLARGGRRCRCGQHLQPRRRVALQGRRGIGGQHSAGRALSAQGVPLGDRERTHAPLSPGDPRRRRRRRGDTGAVLRVDSEGWREKDRCRGLLPGSPGDQAAGERQAGERAARRGGPDRRPAGARHKEHPHRTAGAECTRSSPA